MTAMLPFIDLAAQQRRLRGPIEAAIARVLDHGQYVMGPEVSELEQRLAAWCGAALALSCANGTDALALPLMAWGIGPGDAVFVPSFTFAATPEVIPWVGASPVFVDILPGSYNLDPGALEGAIEAVMGEGRLIPKAVIAVDLFGQCADYPAIAAVCARHGLKLIADSAQAFGATLGGRHPISWADVATTSFFPAKPLGCYGDGGAVLVNDASLWERMDSLRIHGKATTNDLVGREFGHDAKYLNARVGMNSRLDTLQAAILIAKLAAFEEELGRRDRIAARYGAGLAGRVAATPGLISGARSTWAQYTIEHERRDALAAHLRRAGVPTAVYYPVPMHLQAPYGGAPAPGGLPVTEAKARVVLSLPMHADLEEATQDRIIAAVCAFNGVISLALEGGRVSGQELGPRIGEAGGHALGGAGEEPRVVEVAVHLGAQSEAAAEAREELGVGGARLAPETVHRLAVVQAVDGEERPAQELDRRADAHRGQGGGGVHRHHAGGRLGQSHEGPAFQEGDLIGDAVGLGEELAGAGEVVDAGIERVILEHQPGVFRRMGGEAAEHLGHELAIGLDLRMAEDLAVGFALEAGEEERLGIVEDRQALALAFGVSAQQSHKTPNVAKGLRPNPKSAGIHVAGEERPGEDGGREIGQRVADLVGGMIAPTGGRVSPRGVQLHVIVGGGIARHGRIGVDAAELHRHPVRPVVAVLDHQGPHAGGASGGDGGQTIGVFVAQGHDVGDPPIGDRLGHEPGPLVQRAAGDDDVLERPQSTRSPPLSTTREDLGAHTAQHASKPPRERPDGAGSRAGNAGRPGVLSTPSATRRRRQRAQANRARRFKRPSCPASVGGRRRPRHDASRGNSAGPWPQEHSFQPAPTRIDPRKKANCLWIVKPPKASARAGRTSSFL